MFACSRSNRWRCGICYWTIALTSINSHAIMLVFENIITTRHQRCRCLGGTFDIHSNCSYNAIIPFCTAITKQWLCNQLKPISADHNSTGRVYNVQYCPCILNTSEIASIACLHNFSGPALLSCSEILTYQLLGSQLWIALPLKNSRSPATPMINREGANCAITHELSFV